MRSASIPFHVWHLISLSLSIRDVCALQACCSHLRHALNERSVWICALEDLQEIWALPCVLDIHDMTDSELRRTCIRLTRIIERWTGDGFLPQPIYAVDIANASDVKLLPGGKHVLVLERDGTMVLHFIAVAGTIPVRIDREQHQTGHCTVKVLSTSSSAAYVVHSSLSSSRKVYTVYHYDRMRLHFRQQYDEQFIYRHFCTVRNTLWSIKFERLSGHRLDLRAQSVCEGGVLADSRVITMSEDPDAPLASTIASRECLPHDEFRTPCKSRMGSSDVDAVGDDSDRDGNKAADSKPDFDMLSNSDSSDYSDDVESSQADLDYRLPPKRNPVGQVQCGALHASMPPDPDWVDVNTHATANLPRRSCAHGELLQKSRERINSMFGVRPRTCDHPTRRHPRIALASVHDQQIQPSLHATLADGERGYARLGGTANVNGRPTSEMQLPGGRVDSELMSGGETVCLDLDGLTGLIVVAVDNRHERPLRSGALEVYATIGEGPGDVEHD